jgi:hypothetical protein
MDEHEKRIREMTLVALWNEEADDFYRVGQMTEEAAADRVAFWRKAAELYRDRASAYRRTARHFQAEVERQAKRRSKQRQKHDKIADIIELRP